MYGCFACMMYICAMCVSGALGSQERKTDLLELELQMFVSPHVDAGNETWVLWKEQLLTAEPSFQLPPFLIFRCGFNKVVRLAQTF